MKQPTRDRIISFLERLTWPYFHKRAIRRARRVERRRLRRLARR